MGNERHVRCMGRWTVRRCGICGQDPNMWMVLAGLRVRVLLLCDTCDCQPIATMTEAVTA